MEYISLLTDVHLYDRMTAGGKAIYLGELARAGLPVPPGFVVLAPAYERFVVENNLQARVEQLVAAVSPDEPGTAEQAAQAVQKLFEQGTLPDEIADVVLAAYRQLGAPAVAVRSSATDEDSSGASFAGLHDTFLYITTAEEVLAALKRCWASLWSARALAYRVRRQIAPRSVRMGVLVQQMVEASAAGILFTCNPVTGASDEIVVNASWGLGEALVSGQVTPDTLTLDKQSGQVKNIDVAEKLLMTVPTTGGVATQEVAPPLRRQATLSTAQIAQLFELGLAVEKLFQGPQDIEWACEHEQIVLLQARPITTRSGRQSVTVHQKDLPVPGDDSWDEQAKTEIQDYDLWTRTNMGENMPDPVTPLTATLWPSFFVLGRLPAKAERAASTSPLPKLDRFYGRVYVNEGAVIHVAIEHGIPTSFLDSTWGSSGRGTRSSDDAIHYFRLVTRLPKTIASVMKAGKEQGKEQSEASAAKPEKSPRKRPRRGPEQLFAQIDQWVDDFQRLDLSQLDDRALWSYVPLWIEHSKELSSIYIAGGLAGIFFYFLERKVSKWTGVKGQASVLLQALSGIYTAEVGNMLWQMASTLRRLQLTGIVEDHPAGEALALLREQPEARPFLAEFATFLQRHGYRCPNDAEMYNPRWIEQPEQVIALLKPYLQMDESANPSVIEQRRHQEREETVQRIRADLRPWQRPLFGWLLAQTQKRTRLRDNNRSYVAKFLLPMRLLFAELGRRWATRGLLAEADDIFFLTIYEINDILGTPGSYIPGEDFVKITAARRCAWRYWQTIVAPSALGPGGVPLATSELTGAYLQGLPASSGRIRGTARLVWNVHEAMKLTPGEILVTQGTDPGWTPVFPLVGGLVLETGGLLSHGAIIAREYGIPAVINVPGALDLIQDGQVIEIDGASGRVYTD